MQRRTLGRTGREVGAVGLGCWQLGGGWGEVSEADAMATLHSAVDAGVTLFDTADVYGDGRSERLVGRLLAERPEEGLTVATKCGRRVAQDPANYTAAALRSWAMRSRDNLGIETIPLTQLHCPPDAVFEDDVVFDTLDGLVEEGVIGAYGVSVETVSQGLRAIRRPGVATVQVIVNAFRHKPIEELLPACATAGVGVLARVPLASGLLSGRYDEATTFDPSDHRSYNRHGEAFDVGETFSGVPYEAGVAAARRLAAEAVPDGWSLPEVALRWLLDTPGVTAVIPGARNPDQARRNAAVGSRPPLGPEVRATIRRIYDEQVRDLVEDRW
ncbi:MAG: aldo/keto reductase [Actinomycetota bacterium]|nr:aldo/keto reductase [Actinomycetota bacterium]